MKNVALTVKSMGITQEALAGVVGCSQSFLSRLLRRELIPSADLAARISDAIGNAVCALHLMFPDGIPAGFGGEDACRCVAVEGGGEGASDRAEADARSEQRGQIDEDGRNRVERGGRDDQDERSREAA